MIIGITVWESPQFSVHAGVGVGTAPGNGTSPPIADPVMEIHRETASREIASTLFMDCLRSCKYLKWAEYTTLVTSDH